MRYIKASWSGFEIDSSEYTAVVNLTGSPCTNLKKFFDSPFIKEGFRGNKILENFKEAIALAFKDDEEKLNEVIIEGSKISDFIKTYDDITDKDLNKEQLIELCSAHSLFLNKFPDLIFMMIDSYVIFKFKYREEIDTELQDLVNSEAKQEDWYEEVGFEKPDYETSLFLVSIVGIPVTYSLPWYDSQYWDYVLEQVKSPHADDSGRIISQIVYDAGWNEQIDLIDTIDEKFDQVTASNVLVESASNSDYYPDYEIGEKIIDKIVELDAIEKLIEIVNSRGEDSESLLEITLRKLDKNIDCENIDRFNQEKSVNALKKVVMGKRRAYYKILAAKVLKHFDTSYLANEELMMLKILIGNIESIDASMADSIKAIISSIQENLYDEDYNFLKELVENIIQIDSIYVKDILHDYLSKTTERGNWWFKSYQCWELAEIVHNKEHPILFDLYVDLLKSENQAVRSFAMEGLAIQKDERLVDFFIDYKIYDRMYDDTFYRECIDEYHIISTLILANVTRLIETIIINKFPIQLSTTGDFSLFYNFKKGSGIQVLDGMSFISSMRSKFEDSDIFPEIS